MGGRASRPGLRAVTIPGDAAVATALRDASACLSAGGVPFAIIGGIAAIIRGIPRHTSDIDLTVSGGATDAASLLATFEAAGITPRMEDALAFAEEHQVLLLVHTETRTPLDVSLAWLPFEEEAIRAAERLTLYGSVVPVVRPEHLIVYKALAWRDRDRDDIRRLLERYGQDLPWPRIRAVVAELAAAMDLPDRVAELEALRDAHR